MKGEEFSEVYHHREFGDFLISASAKGIQHIQRPATQFDSSAFKQGHILIHQTKQYLDDYFNRLNPSLEIPLDMGEMSEFQKKVLQHVREIPYGHTSSYLDIALRLGDKKLTRAVGHANATNPVPFLIPCHRVVGADGDMRGYIFGTKMKQQLLALENPEGFGIQAELFP